MMNDYYQKFIEYIRNTGGKPTIEMFDEDWEPIGQQVRNDMEANGLIKYDGPYIVDISNK